MADWVTISSLATAGGTLVLALATFSSVKSANRSARVAELSLLAGMRPVLIPSHEEDPIERVRFGDGVYLPVPGHGGAVREQDGVVYMALAARNGGTGLAVLHGWRARARGQTSEPAPDVDDFRRQQIDIYVPVGDTSYWLGAMRDPDEPGYAEVLRAVREDQVVQLDLLYSDPEGGQRTIARFALAEWSDDGDGPEPPPGTRRATLLRYFYVDRQAPR